MALTNKNDTTQYIQISEFMVPCTVLETIYEKAHCSSYLVSMALPGGLEEPRFLQVFPPDYADACQHTETALLKAFGRDKVSRINGSDGTSHLLIKVSSDHRIKWNEILQKPLEERIAAVLQLSQYLTASEARGILPKGIDIRTFLQNPMVLCPPGTFATHCSQIRHLRTLCCVTVAIMWQT